MSNVVYYKVVLRRLFKSAMHSTKYVKEFDKLLEWDEVNFNREVLHVTR